MKFISKILTASLLVTLINTGFASQGNYGTSKDFKVVKPLTLVKLINNTKSQYVSLSVFEKKNKTYYGNLTLLLEKMDKRDVIDYTLTNGDQVCLTVADNQLETIFAKCLSSGKVEINESPSGKPIFQTTINN